MNDQTNNTNTNAGEANAAAAPHVDPATDVAPGVVADEMLAHGLLTYLHKDSAEVQGQRVDRVITEIGVLTGSLDEAGHRRLRFPIRTARGWMAAAACVGLIAGAAFFGFPGETSAQAVIAKSIATMKGNGDRRYEVRMQHRGQKDLPVVANATVDTRPGRMLLRTMAPDGHEVVVGRDEIGDWAIRIDGGVERGNPQAAWPRWATVGDESLAGDSVDRLLDAMTKTYTLERKGDESMKGHGDTKFRHIAGTKNVMRSPGGDHVDLWIDPATNVVERLEMRWDVPAGPAGGENQPPGDGQDNGPPPQRGDRPPPRRGPGGPGGPEGGGDGGMPDDGPGPRGEPMDGPPPGGPMGGPMDGPPRGGPRPGPGPGGPDGPGPRGPMGDGDGPGARPSGGEQDGPGGGAGGRGDRHPPPLLLLMQRVEAPNFEAGWFGPDAHVKK